MPASLLGHPLLWTVALQCCGCPKVSYHTTSGVFIFNLTRFSKNQTYLPKNFMKSSYG